MASQKQSKKHPNPTNPLAARQSGSTGSTAQSTKPSLPNPGVLTSAAGLFATAASNNNGNSNNNNNNGSMAGRSSHQSSAYFGHQFSQKWQQEREEIVRFWLSLADGERRKMLVIDKHDLLQRMKEQSRQTMCHCEACSRRGNFIEDELDQIYDHFYRELSLAHQPISSNNSAVSPAAPGDKKQQSGSPKGLVASGSKEDLSGAIEKSNRLPNASTPPAPFKMGWDDLDDHYDHTLMPLGNGKLSFAEELFADDYRKFMVMIEHLPVQESVDFDDDDDGESDSYVESDEDFSDGDYSDQDVIPSDDDDESATSGERLEESRRMFQIFAAKIMEERVVKAYMERQAEDEREKFMRELYEEDERKKQADLKKKQKKASQKEKKRLELQQKDEEKKRKEEERRQEEEAKRKAEEDRREQQRLEKERVERERRELEEKQFQEQMEKLRKEREENERLERERAAAEAALLAATEEAAASAEAKAKKKKSKKKKKSISEDASQADEETGDNDDVPVQFQQPAKTPKKSLHPLPQLEKQEQKHQERVKIQELNSQISSSAVGLSSLLSPPSVPPGIQTAQLRPASVLPPPVNTLSGFQNNNTGIMNLFPQQLSAGSSHSRDSPIVNNPVPEDPIVQPVHSKPVQPIGHRGSIGDTAFSIVNNPMLHSMPQPISQTRKWASGLVPSFDPFSSRSLFDLDTTEPANLSMFSGPSPGASSSLPGQFSMPPPHGNPQSAFHHPGILQQQPPQPPPNLSLPPHGQAQQQQQQSHFPNPFNTNRQ